LVEKSAASTVLQLAVYLVGMLADKRALKTAGYLVAPTVVLKAAQMAGKKVVEKVAGLAVV